MERVELYDRSGMYVAAVLVPPFKTPPDAIVWGTRTFFWSKEREQWREGFTYCVPISDTQR